MRKAIIFCIAIAFFLYRGCLIPNDDLVPMEFYFTTYSIPIKAEIQIFDGMNTYKTYQVDSAHKFDGQILVLDEDYEYVEPFIKVRIKTGVDTIASFYNDSLSIYLSISLNGKLLGEMFYDQTSADSLIHIDQQNGGADANNWNWFDFNVLYTKPSGQ